MGIANKECGSKTYHKLGCLQCQGHRPCLSREHHVYPPSSLSVLLSILLVLYIHIILWNWNIWLPAVWGLSSLWPIETCTLIIVILTFHVPVDKIVIYVLSFSLSRGGYISIVGSIFPHLLTDYIFPFLN